MQYTCKCVLIDFSLTVKATTLIFISGRGSAILSAKEGESDGEEFKISFCAAQTCVHIMKLNSHLLTLETHNQKLYVFVVH